MQWFAGNVQTAIQISRKNQALLVVYITNDTADGRLFDSFWDQIDTSILSCAFVGIKLKAGETAAQQFADIYPTPILPAAYLINQSGDPLEVITPLVGKEYDQFRAKLNKAVEQFLKNAPAAPAPAPAATAPTPAATALPPTPAPAPAPAQVPATSESRARETVEPEIHPSLAEKVARAKELLRIHKQKEEEQQRISEKHQKEELMKAQKTRQELEDKALMEAAKQRKKEKLEAGKEKERILAQIKADREDAKKRFGAKAENAPAPAETLKSDNVGKAIPSDRCRLQVRLPDGSTFVEEFPSNDVLKSLIEIIRQKPSVTGPFSINQSYPRRVFTEADFSKTYLENQLTPSSTLIVVLTPTTSVTSSAVVASTSVFSLLFSPFLLIWNLFSGWFGGVVSTGSAAAAAKSQPRVPSGAGPQNPGAARPRGMPRPAEVRRRGNVAGLENPNDDDPEEKASFNGNSTQFM